MRGKWGIVLILVILATAGACSLLPKDRRQEPAAQATHQPEEPPVGDIGVAGIIRARNTVSVGAPVSGLIESFLVDAGEEVFEGQLLARISSQGYETAREIAKEAVEDAQSRVNKLQSQTVALRAESARAQANAMRYRAELDRADKVYQRQKVLHNAGATPRMAFEKAQKEFESSEAEYQSFAKLGEVAESRVATLQSELDAARRVLDEKTKQLDGANAQLRAADVHSPVDGVVVGRKGESGSPVGPQEAHELFQIAVDLGNLTVVVEPEPPVLARIQPGQPALILVPDLQSEGIPGTVHLVNSNQAIIEFVSPNSALRPGMSAQVRIAASAAPAEAQRKNE